MDNTPSRVDQKGHCLLGSENGGRIILGANAKRWTLEDFVGKRDILWGESPFIDYFLLQPIEGRGPKCVREEGGIWLLELPKGWKGKRR
jgi:hypothetical protein